MVYMCVVVVALLGRPLKARDETHNFWKRVETIFQAIDMKGDGNGSVSRKEMAAHFRGNTVRRSFIHKLRFVSV